MKLGDLFAKLAAGDSLSASEIEALRLGMNQQQGITSQMSALLTPSGDLDIPLPPTGTFYKTAAQEIATGGAFAAITWDETNSLTVVNGMSFTPATDPTTFVIPGGAGATYLISVRVVWEGHATGARSLLLVTNEANRFQATVYTPDANDFQMEWVFMYHAVAKEVQFALSAAQTSGVALDIKGGNCYFSIARIR